jgi:UDP-N-acetylmuramate--alanine ligase
VDYFKDMEQITEPFARFASLTGKDGVTVVNLDDENVMESARRALERGKTGRLVTFSAQGNPAADFIARSIRTEGGLPCFELMVRGESRGEIPMAVPGRHQVINALAAAAAMDAAGIDPAAIRSGLTHYIGAGRRMERKGEINGAIVYDDYGHHPTEVKATLEGAKALCTAAHPDGRLICVFQPHTYSRTAALYGEFLTAFDAADKTLLIDIYAAREDNIYGVSSEGLAKELNSAAPDKAAYCPSPAHAAAAIRAIAREGDTVVIMGAGDVIKVTASLFEM